MTADGTVALSGRFARTEPKVDWQVCAGQPCASICDGWVRAASGARPRTASRSLSTTFREVEQPRSSRGCATSLAETDQMARRCKSTIGEERHRPRRMWNMAVHDARDYGTRRCSKSLLRAASFRSRSRCTPSRTRCGSSSRDKPDAVVLDFFAGSGTTAHAVMRLNRQDGGRRQSHLVTNNEVAADEQKALREKGLRPGDPEWEQLGDLRVHHQAAHRGRDHRQDARR